MTTSRFQISLKPNFVQAEFHPRNASVLVLHGSGEMDCYTSSGETEWEQAFDCKAMVFRMNAEGTMLAVLGEKTLILHDIWRQTRNVIQVSEKARMLDFHKNCPVVGGYQKTLHFLKPNGKPLKTIVYDYLIRRFKIVRMTDQLILYNQGENLICMDVRANVRWTAEHIRLIGDIWVSDLGKKGYYLQYPGNLVQFDLTEDAFYRIDAGIAVKRLCLSQNGESLLLLDAENALRLFDADLNLVWQTRFPQDVRQMKISHGGDFFLIVDADNILTVYSTPSAEAMNGDFFEFREKRQVEDRPPCWTLKSVESGTNGVWRALTVNPSGLGLAFIAPDGKVHFADEDGNRLFDISFPGVVDAIAICPDLRRAVIYGERQAITADIQEKTAEFAILDRLPLKWPLVNFQREKIFLPSRDKQLLICDFRGKTLKKIQLKQKFQDGVSCGADGVALYCGAELALFDEDGTASERFTLKHPVESLWHRAGRRRIIGVSKNHVLFSIDLASKTVQYRKLKGGAAFTVLSRNPLFITDDEGRMIHLNDDMSVAAVRAVQSARSMFRKIDGEYLEIVRDGDRLLCFNGAGQMIWRHHAGRPIREHALTRNGLVYLTQDAAACVRLTDAAAEPLDFSHFLEF